MCRALCLGIGDITVDQPGMAVIHLFPLPLSPKSKLSSPLSWTAVRASTWPSHVHPCSLVVYSKHRNYVTPRLKHLSRLSGLLRIKAEVGDRTPRDLCLPHRHVVSCHRLPHALLQSCRLSGCFSNKPVMLLPRGLQGRYTPCSLSPSVLTPDTHVAHFRIAWKSLLKYQRFAEAFNDSAIYNCNICLASCLSTSFSLYIHVA